MFGIIVSGRLVQTDFQRVGETQFLFNIADAGAINHLVVFMTGTEPFPPAVGGSVYFSWPDPNAPPSWQLLGHISNEKPSAIFKISNLKKDVICAHPFLPGAVSLVAQIGISVESTSQMSSQTPLASAAPSPLDSFTEFTAKMVESLFLYVASFAQTQAQMLPNPNETYVPLRTLQTWFDNFQRRLRQNPNFWRN